MFNRKKRQMTKKQKETLKRMKKNRQLDSDNLREVINQKLKWATTERLKGLEQSQKLQTQIYKLEGIILFIKDLLQPKEEKKEEKK